MAQVLPQAGVGEYVADREFRLLVGGELRAAHGAATRDVYDPSTGQVLARAPEASPADVDAAVTAARQAQPAWEALGVRGRGRYFSALAEVIEAHREELAMLDALNGGNPVAAMRVDVDISLANIRDWPALALGLHGQTIPASPTGLHYTRYEPYGVVGRITAFNHPAMFAMTRMLAALIVGNAVVLKPGVQTPLSALAFGEIVHEVLPPGVLNIVSGGVDTGAALTTHPRVKRIGFTGSVRTGLAIQRSAAEAGLVKHISLELGGKNAMVVFPDADLADAVEGAAKGMNFEICQGQSCGSNSRVLVHRDRHDEFVAALAERCARIRVGPAYDDDVDMGPLVSAEHLERVQGYVEAGRREGARLATGGRRPEGLDGGYFLSPTVFGDVTMDMAIAREEIFGPVISVLPWDDYDAMIEQANGVDYGLTASVWTENLHLAHVTAARLQAGYVWVNDSSTHYWGTPFGGVKSSGLGREESMEELQSYLELKSVHVMLKDPRPFV